MGACFGYSDLPLTDLKTKYANPPSSFVNVDGMAVHFRDEGDYSDTIPVVLLHGTGSSLHTFDAWTNTLKKQRRVIRLDLPAYGLTGPFPDRNYSVEHYVDFIEHFLNRIGVKQCVIGGNSLGGGIAWNYTVKYPHRVEKLILINASGYPTKSESVPVAFRLARVPVISTLFKWITPRFVAKSSVDNVYHDNTKVTKTLVDRYFELTLREGNRQAFVDRLQTQNDTTRYHSISSIQQPTLILWGEYDQLIPVENAHKFHNDLTQSQLVIMNDVGHVPMEELPQESLKAVLVFLKN
jgi:pimeloyl-ACP methyl ester carboxylesterase